MPLIHWYLLKNYLRVLLLSVSSFIAILLMSRLEDIAQFAAMGAKPLYILLFTLFQIPYILPFALPISCLISSLLLFQNLSQTHELTAIRSSGIALKKLISPILLTSFFLALVNFYTASEISTSTYHASRKMLFELTSVNPLLLLQNAKTLPLEDVFVQMESKHGGESAQNLVVAIKTPKGDRLNLCLVDHVEMEEKKLTAQGINIISSLPNKEGLDHLVIENQKSMSSSASDLAQLLSKTKWNLSNKDLNFRMLRLRTQELSSQVQTGESTLQILNKCRSEFVRRFSLAASTFTFALLGACFGIQIGRKSQKKRRLFVLMLSAAALMAFFMGKTFDRILWLSCLCFCLPHLAITFASFWSLKRVNEGIE